MSSKEKALAVVNKCELAMIGTVDELGKPQIKMLMKTKNNGLKEFWFCSNTSAKRTKQIKENPASCLYFTTDEWEGVMLNGFAELSYDDEMRKSFWDDFMFKYYPEGPLDPDFVLIKFVATSGNYYKSMVNEDFEI